MLNPPAPPNQPLSLIRERCGLITLGGLVVPADILVGRGGGRWKEEGDWDEGRIPLVYVSNRFLKWNGCKLPLSFPRV